MKWESVEDGLSNTLLVGEKHVIPGRHEPSVANNGGGDGSVWSCNEWNSVARLAGVIFPIARGPHDDLGFEIFGSWHPSVCHFGMCDGSVRALSTSVGGFVLEYLANRHDGKVIRERF